ncbi:MAG TPA: ribosome biogenesis GTPase Der [bacterium]|nr:ribosome biogenesis GTPase Der [bacterium]HMZ04168.1 ribosome biogenesis GTPase Der [bacterium]HNB56317.1 ribosome biogenesis GTPase Der [bacterium]HND78302.1 ribosome biogenesis GTPase Der [bacterium]HNE84270.1 ribosome biogenesis GTPase Der [bacterium]
MASKKINRLPVVTIVGRPNVGKSTLFNRIIGRQDAIVDGTPGVTRDRHYEIAEWRGKNFILIDTGGFIPDSHDLINTAIREQAQLAIDESDLVILLIDAVSQLSTTEMKIADVLKRSKKTSLLIVNKVDNEKVYQNTLADQEIYKLAMGQPLMVSALNSRHIGDMLDRIMTALGDRFAANPDEITTDTNTIRLAIIGRPNVGKSSLVNAIIGKNKHIVSDIPGTTRDAIDTDFIYNDTAFKLIDTAGLRRKAKVKENLEFYSTLRTLKTIQECDVAILLIDAIDGLAAQDIRVLEEARQLKKGLILVVNKWDLVKKTDKTALDYEKHLDKALGATKYIPYVFTSALTKQRVAKVLETAKKVHDERNRTIATAQLNRFLERIIARNHPPAVRGKEIKLNYATQIKSRPPVFAIFSNEPTLIPANYRQYIENQMRDEFGFEGVPLSLTFRKKSRDRYE